VRILLVEDERGIADFVERALRGQGHDVEIATDGPDGERGALEGDPDLVILDVMLPGRSGIEVLRNIRRAKPVLPVIMLTARAEVADKVKGLDAGATDYITKPFSVEELLARVRAVARRGRTERPTVVEVGTLRLDPAARRAWRGTVELELSSREFAVLELLMRSPGLALTRLQILDGAWDMAFEGRSNIVDVYMRYLREKVDRPFGCTSIETVRGVGYRLREDGG